MKLKYRLVPILAIVALLLACNKEDDLKPSSPDDLTDVSLRPGRAGTEMDEQIEELHKTTNTYFLYEFTEQEIKWNLVAGASGGTVHLYKDYKLTETENLEKQFNWVKKTLTDVFSDDFKVEFLPYKVIMAGGFTDIKWKDDLYQTAYSTNTLIYGYGNKQDGLKISDKYSRFQLEQRNYLNWLETTGKLRNLFNDKFFEVSDYSLSIRGDWIYYKVPDETKFRNVDVATDEMLNNGFLGANSASGSVSSRGNKDAMNYYYFMMYFPKNSPLWERFLSFPKVKEKYDYFRNHCLENYNFDPHKLGEVSFE